MADIFVSYARTDRARVAPLVSALEAEGFSVWWDPEMVGGQEFDALITRELEAAKAAVVVWTPASVVSRWVRGEARFAADRGVLTPIQLDAPNLPLDFRAIHTIDFDGWNEDTRSRPFQDLTRALNAVRPAVTTAAAPAPATPKGVSICVLPFANMSRDDDQEYFADGVTEDVITDLSKVSALFVIARNTAFTFKGRSLEVPEIARRLRVTHVLEGSVRRVGNRVRITAELIDGTSGGHVWADRWDRDLDDIFALQDEMSAAIVDALKLKLLPADRTAIETRPTTSFEAYDKFLRARALGAAGVELPRATEMLREVLRLDPDFEPARGALALVLFFGLTFLSQTTKEAIEELERTVREALAHAPDQWGSRLMQCSLAFARRDWITADAALAKMLPATPAHEPDPRAVAGMVLCAMGRLSESIRELETARRADPLGIGPTSGLTQVLYIAGRDEEAETEYRRTEDLPGNRYALEHARLLRIWETGTPEEVKAQFRRLLGCGSIPIAALGRLIDVMDDPPASRALLREALEDPANHDATRTTILGWHAAIAGDDELALQALHRSFVDLKGGMVQGLWFPFLRRVHRLGGFKQLIRDLGLYDYWRASGNWGDFARPVGEDDFEIIR
jgi:adenylate cyclase